MCSEFLKTYRHLKTFPKSTLNTDFQAYAMDGREPIPDDLTGRQLNFNPTASSVQSTAFTICVGLSILNDI